MCIATPHGSSTSTVRGGTSRAENQPYTIAATSTVKPTIMLRASWGRTLLAADFDDVVALV